MSFLPNRIFLGDGPQLDAFQRLRIAIPNPIFQDQWPYSADSLNWQNLLTGSGTVTFSANDATVVLSNGGTASGAQAIRQTKVYWHYYPGQGILVLASVILGAQVANVTKRIGYFDASNGIFFEQTGTTVSWVLRSSSSGSIVDNNITQPNWNLDKMDGTGPSGIVLDSTKDQVLIMDAQWLGMGRVRVGFITGGTIHYVHEFKAANILSTTYMARGSLPVRTEITNTGVAGSTISMKVGCVAVSTEGSSIDPLGIRLSANNSAIPTSVTTRRPVLSLRCRTLMNSLQVRGHLHMLLSSATVGSGTALMELVFNGTLTDASPNWTDVNTTYSIAQFNTSATAITGGVTLQSGYVSGGSTGARGTGESVQMGLPPVSNDIAGTTSDILSIVATASSGAVLVNASMEWLEHQ